MFGHRVGAVQRHALAERVQRQAERDPGADRVRVGVAVRHDRHGLGAAQRVDELFHDRPSRSRASRSSVEMRAARSAVWSDTNVRSGT